MLNPFLVLNVPVTASDAEIRLAWQRAVQACPPEKDGERFQAVQEAYEAIRDERCRWRWHLFHEDSPGDSPVAALRRVVRLTTGHRPLPAAALRSLVRAAASPDK